MGIVNRESRAIFVDEGLQFPDRLHVIPIQYVPRHHDSSRPTQIVRGRDTSAKSVAIDVKLLYRSLTTLRRSPL